MLFSLISSSSASVAFKLPQHLSGRCCCCQCTESCGAAEMRETTPGTKVTGPPHLAALKKKPAHIAFRITFGCIVAPLLLDVTASRSLAGKHL